ncbi:MAG: hypothetical protein ACHQHN_15300 [Sphingobacteriales bacterium]
MPNKECPASYLKNINHDLDKCLDDKETGIPKADIIKIIYCHNSRLSPSEAAELTDHCRNSGVALELKGIDDIALLLLGRAAYAAKLFLGINIDTAQIIPVKQFVNEYEASGFATLLSNQFIGRENELAQLHDLINNNQITIIKGPPGTGKSRLVIACLDQFRRSHPDYEVFCISNKNAPIFEDLRVYLNGDGNFLLFIDDANRQVNNLKSLLPMLREQRAGRIKVVITVRDYAFQDIYHACKDFDPAEMDVLKLTDEQITAIVKTPEFNIQNTRYIRRILEIAEGNPRLAIMAAKVANESQNLLKLHDASEIYDQYFQNAIPDHQLFDNHTLMKTLGVISFFYAIDLTDSEFLAKLLELVGLDRYSFKESVEYLERLELVETSVDYTIAKINDQVLSTFFFYKVFFKEQILDFGVILKNYFTKYTNRIRDSVLPANNTFGYERVLEHITPALNDFWNICKHDHDIAVKFLQTFWFYRFEDVFAYLWDYVQALPDVEQEYNYNEDRAQQAFNTDIYLDLLDNFYLYNLPQTFTAVELSFEYVRKTPKLFTHLVKALAEKFVFSYEDSFNNFQRQKKLFRLMYENFNDPLYREAFFILGAKFLHMIYRVHTASRQKNTISWYQYKLEAVVPVIKFRKLIWKRVIANYRKFPKKVEAFLDRYLTMSPDWVEEVTRTDVPHLLTLYQKFSTKNFAHCYLVQENIWWFNRLGINDDALTALKPVFTNDTYRQYRLVTFDRLRDKSEYDFDDYEKYAKLKDNELRTAMLFKDLNEFKRFYQRFLLITEWFGKKKPHRNYNETIDVILQANYEHNPQLGWRIVQFMIKEGNTADLYLWRIIKSVQERANARRLKNFYDLIINNHFQKKTSWVVLYFDFLPEKYVEQQKLDQLLIYLEQNEEAYLHLYFENFIKFLKVDPDYFVRLLKVINYKNEVKKLKWAVDHQEFEKNFENFNRDMEVLQQAYLLQDESQDFFDFSCDLLFKLVDEDPTFLNRYVNFLIKDRFFISSREYHHLNRIWTYKNAEQLMESTIVLIGSKALISRENGFVNAFFENLTEPPKTRAAKFLKDMIKKFAKNISVIEILMDIVLASFKGHKNEFIKHLLTVNDDYTLFTEIQWVENSYTGSADTNFDAVRAGNWQAILNILNEINKSAYRYAKHKAFVMSNIDYYNKRAQAEDRYRFMTDRF